MRWLGPIDRKWSNQNALIAVRIRPLSGTGSSITTSNALHPVGGDHHAASRRRAS